MRDPYTQSERQCDECGEMFWGTEAALFCSKACRQRSWRARQMWVGLREPGLPSLCREVYERGKMSFTRFRGRSDYAANAASFFFNSNSMGLA